MITRTTLFSSSYPAIRYTQSSICTSISALTIQKYYPAHDAGFRFIPDGFDNANGMITNTLVNKS